MATYLVTGGAGFIGSHVVHELVRRGEVVRVLDNLSTGRIANLAEVSARITFLEADICGMGMISPHFKDAHYVIHLAALPSVARSVDDPLTANAVNLTGTLNVLLAARDAGVKRLVLAASAAAYGDNPTMPRVETLTPDPLSPYALAKVAGEYYCQIFTRIYGLETVALRYFNIFGPRQNPDSPYSGVLSKFVAAYQRGDTPVIFGDGQQSRDFTYVDNVVDATLRACTAPAAVGKVINVGVGRSYTLNQTIALLDSIFGREVRPQHAPPRKGDALHSLADISLARQALGYEPRVSFEEGLRRTVDWFRTAQMNEMEIIRNGVSACEAKVALFDFDGTLSLIRAGWVDVMVPMMVEILAELKTGEEEEDLRALVDDFVARLTGEQTIYQMIELAHQVEKRGGESRPPLEYKRMYHDRLMRKIEYRREELRQGKVSPDRYLVPGARGILESLKARGLKLYCASGTDETYTLEEARLLEIDPYFDGRIYGARDDYKSFSKEILIRQMVSSMEGGGKGLIGFGDGYVEIRNVKDAGGVAVGVATDEPECRLVNQWKRERLLKVGADFIVPNFLCWPELSEALFPNCRVP